MSWLAPKHLEDASRILRGLALVAAKMASDSKLARRAAVSDYKVALQYAADLLQQQANAAQEAATGAPGHSAPAPPAESSPSSGTSGAGEQHGPFHTITPTHQTHQPHYSTTSDVSQPGPRVTEAGTSTGSSLHGATAHVAPCSATAGTAAAFASATPAAAPSFAAQGLAQPSSSSSSSSSSSFPSTATAEPVVSTTSRPEPPYVAATSAPPQLAVASVTDAYTTGAAVAVATAESAAAARTTEPPLAAVTAPVIPQAAVEAPAAATATAAEAGAAPDDVAPGDRLLSVHDDMVVAAIAAANEAARDGARAVGGSSTAPAESQSAAAAAPAVAPAAAAEGPAEATSGRAAATAAAGAAAGSSATQGPPPQPQAPARKLRERRVPETPLGRALGFAGLGASLIMGSIADNIGRALRGPAAGGEGEGVEAAGPGAAGGRRGGGGGGGGGNAFLTEANAERLANALCRMRGAALKIGQMLSIQDESVLPPQVQAALERVRAGADVMPRSQLEGVLVSELGPDWQQQLSEFDWEPRAAASIGQVHTAVLRDGRRVAMKIQYPGVARSIESDVDNLMRLIAVANILPRGLYAENAARVAKRELALECDYTYELACQQRYRRLIAADPQLAPHFHVPDVVPGLSSQRILTTEWVSGVPIDKVRELSQEVRDVVGTRLLQLTLRELFEWRFMQTDPNWGNFLYDTETDKLNLIDFGASKDYPESFVMDYMRMVAACAERDRQGVIDMSVKLGFLTGDESEVMMEAHTQAGFVVGVPFAAPGLYDFGSHGGMTSRVSELGAVMLKHRLTPPPQDSYSLHRKLSGAFLACMKLKAKVPCREMFFRTYESKLGPFVPPRLTTAEGDGLTAASGH